MENEGAWRDTSREIPGTQFPTGAILALLVLLALGVYGALFHPEPFWAGFWGVMPW